MAAIAVLPLENLSADPDDAFFALGLTDEIGTQLHNVSAMRVTSKTSTMTYRDTDKTIRTIAEELGVRYVIEGSAQALGDRIRINLQLIDAPSDAHLWADTFERSKDDLFAVQAEIAERVARAVHVRLQPHERRRLAAEPTQNADAYAWFLKAKAHTLEGWRGGNRGEVWPHATEAYKRAIEIDSTFALAYAELAMHLDRSMWLGVARTDEDRELAATSLQRAVELAPDAPRTRLAQATDAYFPPYRDYARALEELEKVRQVMPADADHLFMLGGTYRRLARFEDAVAAWEESLALDPLNGQVHFELVETNLRLRRYRDAERAAQRALGLGFGDERSWKARLAEARGDVAERRRLIEESVAEEPGSVGPFGQWSSALQARDPGAALAAVEDLSSDLVLYESATPFPADLWKMVALHYLGDANRAKALAEKSIPQYERWIEEGVSPWRHRQMLSMTYIMAGRADDGARLMREELAKPDLPPCCRDHWAGRNRLIDWAAMMFTMAGEHDEALEQLEILLEMDEYPYIGGDGRVGGAGLSMHRWDPLRDDPRFQRIQARADSIDRALGWDPTPSWDGSP
jgi:TolB-like protein